ncbi:NAD-dependent epimerase/dehydratase family protein [Calditrichota bacterium]
MTRILVTGGAGFIGSKLADALIGEGNQVTIIDNLSTGKIENVNPDAKFIEMDIRDAEVSKVFEDGGFDIVFHEAAQIDLRESVATPIENLRINLEGSLNLLESARRHGVKKFIFASTGGVIYGNQEVFPAPESHPTKPISPYAVSKLAFEHYMFMYSYQFQMDCIALRYANVYGPRQNPFGEAGVIAIFAEQILRNKQPYINGDGKQTRDYVYIDDVVSANQKAIALKGFNAVNIGTGVETSVLSIFSTIKHLTGTDIEVEHRPEAVGDQRRSSIDPALANELLDWKPNVEIEEGIRRTVEYFRQVR